ncbi:MAG: DUF262 domain-containing protein [Propionibacteriaceae bacterium]|jgi:hypothetical protein|nr:DUF262 domain-containing protein [Propionibacteriaceae bacterium]
MSKTDMKVWELVAKIDQGELQLPEMQRRYVWTKTQVRDLLDSLYRGYPSGVILAWQPSTAITGTHSLAVDTDHAPVTTKPLLLLDGQQRLTSLTAVLKGQKVTVRNRVKPIDILFNLDHPDQLEVVTEAADSGADEPEDDLNDVTDDLGHDELSRRANRRAFIVYTKRLAALPNWVCVTDVFTQSDTEILKQAGVTGWDDPKYERYLQRLATLRAIRDYEYRVDILEEDKSYEEVTEIFVRVNSLGAKLRSADLAMAQVTAKWPGSLQLFDDYLGELSKRGFELDYAVPLRVMVALLTNQSHFHVVAGFTADQLKWAWAKAQHATNHAIDFLQKNCGIANSNQLTSPFLIVATAAWAHSRDYVLSGEEERSYRRWLLIANAKGRYSRGSTETILDQDLAVIRDGGGPTELTSRLRQQFGKLGFSADDLIGRSTLSGVFKTLFIAFASGGARDWQTKLNIAANYADKANRIEYHHIFPKAYMKALRPELGSREIDDIANLAFIGAKTNKVISDKAPHDYAQSFESTDLLAQAVDFSEGLDQGDQFEVFRDRRRLALAKTLNNFLHTEDDV